MRTEVNFFIIGLGVCILVGLFMCKMRADINASQYQGRIAVALEKIAERK